MDDYFKSLFRVLGIGAAFAAIPLMVAFAELQPPWPPAIGYVSSALVLLSSLAAWEWTRKSSQRARRAWFISAFFLTLIGLGSYLALYSMFIEVMPGTNYRVVRGYECTAEAIAVYKNQCPHLSRDALRDAEWENVVLWTRGSITFVRLGLTFAWLIFTAGLICAVGAIVAGRKMSRAGQKARR